MSDVSSDRPAPRLSPISMLRDILAGCVTGAVSFSITVSFAAVVFSGPLQSMLSDGLRMILFGGIVFALTGATLGARTGTQYQTQSVTAVIAILAISRMAAGAPDVPISALFWSSVTIIALSTALTGVIFVLVGMARLGHMARFIPYPVLGGFLAATGLFLLNRAVSVSVPGVETLSEAMAHFRLWAPPVGLGILLVLIERLTGMRQLLLWGIGLVALIAHFGMALLGADAPSGEGFLAAAQTGLLDHSPFVWSPLGGAYFELISSQAPLIFALAGLALVAALVNASAIEIELGRNLDLNGELRRAGLANIVSSVGGGLVGYHSLSLTKLGQAAGGTTGWLITASAATVFILAALFGVQFLHLVPVAALSLVLAYIGADLMYRWLWAERSRMSAEDNAVVLIILAASALFGFVVALGTGIVAASMLFTVSYSRLQVVRNAVSGALRRSSTERPEADNVILSDHGAQTLIFELQGFIFFGTASGILRRIEEAVAAPENPVRYLLIDFRRVQAMDTSAVSTLRKLRILARQWRVELILTGMSDTIFEMMNWAENTEGVTTYRLLDEGLAVIEDQILETRWGADAAQEASPLTALLAEVEALGHGGLFQRRDLAANETLFARGATADSLVFLETGRLAAVVETGRTRKTRVASFLPGAVVGEVGFYGDIPRTAGIMAEVPSRVRILPREALEALEARDPELAARFHALLAQQLARRLARTTALVYAIDS